MSAVAAAKRLGRRGVDLLGAAMARWQIGQVRRATNAGDTIVVLDIDNTLADAWPSFLRPYGSQRERLAGLEVLPNVKKVLHDDPLVAGATIVYLSHRNLWEWPVTYRWLRDRGFVVRPDRLVLVPNAAAKLPHLRRLARGRTVILWDDLSHGHETGTVTFYDDLITQISRASLTYHGWADIVTLSGLGLERD